MSNYIYKGVDKIKYEEMISSKDLLYSLYEIGMHQVSGFISLNEIYIILYKLYGNTIIFLKRSLKFSKNLNDLVLVDDEILLNICNITNVGIKPFNDTYILDEDIFVNENFQK